MQTLSPVAGVCQGIRRRFANGGRVRNPYLFARSCGGLSKLRRQQMFDISMPSLTLCRRSGTGGAWADDLEGVLSKHHAGSPRGIGVFVGVESRNALDELPREMLRP